MLVYPPKITIGLLLLVAAAPLSGQPAGTVLRVNDEALSSVQIIAGVRAQLSEWAPQMDQQQFVAQAEPVIRQAVQTHLFELLLYQHAKSEFEKNESYETALEGAMQQERKALLAQYDGSPATAQAQLTRQGSSIEDELEAARRRLVLRAYQEAYFVPTDEITRSQMLQYYQTHLEDKYQKKPVIQFRLVDIPVRHYLPDYARDNTTDEQWAQARAQADQAAQQAWQQIRSGADFSQVVKDFSQGFRKKDDGLWRPLDPDSLQQQYKPIAEAMTHVGVGHCSGIVEQQEHFFIAKLVDYQPARTIPFSQAQFEIAEILRQQSREKYWIKLQTSLLEKASIGNVTQFIHDTTMAAYQQFRQKPQGAASTQVTDSPGS